MGPFGLGMKAGLFPENSREFWQRDLLENENPFSEILGLVINFENFGEKFTSKKIVIKIIIISESLFLTTSKN